MCEDSAGDAAYKVIMHPLKHLIHKKYKEILNTAVVDLNNLTRQLYDFIKFHCLRMYEDDEEFKLNISQNGIRKIADILTSLKINKEKIKDKSLSNSYEKFKTATECKKFQRTRYDRLIMELCTEVSTSIKNNIQLHFCKRLRTFCFNYFYTYKDGNKKSYKEKIDEIKEDHKIFKNPIDYNKISTMRKEIHMEVNAVMFVISDHNDEIFNYNLEKIRTANKNLSKIEKKNKIEELTKARDECKELCDKILEKYGLTVRKLKKKVLPKNQNKKLSYELKQHPENFIQPMIYMNKWNEEHGIKQFKCFPERNINELKYVTFSTCGLETLFSMKKIAKVAENEINTRLKKLATNKKSAIAKKSNTITKNDTTKKIKITPTTNPDFYWNTIFKLRKFKKITDKGLHVVQIKTDGVGASICFYDGESKKVCKVCKEEKYIDGMKSAELNEMIGKRDVVYIDPGMNNIIMCMSDKDNKCFKYTSRQRHHEIKTKYMNECDEKLRNEIERNKIEINKILKEKYERMNHVSCTFETFSEYLKCKYDYGRQNAVKYHQEVNFNKNKFRRKIYKKRAIQKLMSTMKRKYGNAIIVYGDWSTQENLKNNEPVIKNKLKREIKKRFKTYMLDEYKTSKIHNITGKEVTNLVRKEMKTKVRGNNGKIETIVRKNVKVHQILESKTLKEVSESTEHVNKNMIVSTGRDRNAVMNYKKILEALRKGKKRPKEYRRPNDLTASQRLRTGSILVASQGANE